jgi:ribosomal protein S18 acetylase RimI-like enzyme
MIRKASRSDMNAVAKIHKQQFKDHFLGRYSINMIQKFYETYLECSCTFLVSEADGIINGFIMGGRYKDLNKAKQKFIHDNKLHYIVETMIRPSIYLLALKRLKIIKPTNEPISTDTANSVSLLSIAVSERAKGTGTASELVNEFEKHTDSEDYSLTVKKTNRRAIQFYYRHGFELKGEKEFTVYLTKMLTT